MDLQKPNGTGDVEDHLPLPGFRFHPTDEELVGFYLRRKVDKKQSSIELIKQVDIYKYDPWDLPKVSTVIGEKEWYFFCMRGRKYRNSFRPNRVTGSGFWKATGIDRPVYDSQQKQECVIGLKKSLVYYVGSAGKGTKTDWMMHEFRLPPPSSSSPSHKNITNLHRNMQEAETWTICRIFKRNSTYKRYGHEFRSSEHSNVKESSTDCSSVTFRTANSVTQDQNSSSAGGFYNGNKFEKKPLLLAEQFDEGRLMPTYSGQAPVIELTSPVAIRANLAGEFTNDGTWDEIPSIFELSDPWIMNGCIYS